MEYLGYTDQQIRTLRVLLEETEVKGLDNCKNIVMMREIIDKNVRVNVEEVEDGKEQDKSHRPRRG